MQFSVTIPHVFYDLIARVIPGSLFLIMLSYELSDTGIKTPSFGNLSRDLLSTALFVLICTIMPYLLGWVLCSFSFLSADRKIRREYEGKQESSKDFVSTKEMLTMIRLQNQAVGFGILKCRSEARMLESSRVGMFYIAWVALGLFLLDWLSLLSSSNISIIEWIIRIITPIFLTIGFWKHEYKAWKGYYDSITIHYKILFGINKKRKMTASIAN